MGTNDLPDIYTQRQSVFIRQTASAHCVTLSFNVCGFTILIAVVIAFDCGLKL